MKNFSVVTWAIIGMALIAIFFLIGYFGRAWLENDTKEVKTPEFTYVNPNNAYSITEPYEGSTQQARDDAWLACYDNATAEYDPEYINAALAYCDQIYWTE